MLHLYCKFKIKKANKARLEQEKASIADELSVTSNVYLFNISNYLKYLSKDSSVEVLKEVTDAGVEYAISYHEGMIIERMIADVDSNYPHTYSVEAAKPHKSLEGFEISSGELAFNLLSNFLMDAAITDRPLGLVIDYNLEKQKEYAITENISLVVDNEKPKKFILFKLLTTRSTE